VKVVGALSPPFADIDKWPIDELKAAVRRTKPHILWVGLGAPKQELWMAKMSGALDVPVMLGVGAGIDYLGGAKPSAPTFLRHVGLEWLFRLAMEPRRLWRRYLLGNSAFVYLLGRGVLKRQLERIGSSWTPPGRGR
jgi:N-acetylglucosaminyldiphosphoundecaprenol N-acetyl-beta-D-mannosaminyltransferase